MRRDYLIAIILALSALPAGVALMVAPEYLHLSGAAIPLVFWGGIAVTLALIVAAAFIALHGAGVGRERGMTASDIGYNAAIAAAVVSLMGTVRRSPRVAVIACIVAWVGIGVDYWFGPPRTFFFLPQPIADQIFKVKDSPMVWHVPSPMPTEYTLSDEPIYIDNILVQGNNIGDREVSLDDVYLISEMTGERLDLHLSYPGKDYFAKDLNPIPPGAVVVFFTDNFQPALSTNEFLRKWRTMTLIFRHDGQDHRIMFDEEAIRNRMPTHLLQGPHVTLRNQN
jgi:hypothetical protein